MFTVSEICKLLDVSVETVRRWIRSGELMAEKSGKSYLISKTDLKEYLSKKHSPNSPLIKAIDEKKGLELVGAYLEKVNGVNHESDEEITSNDENLQKLHKLEEQILSYEMKVNHYEEKILLLKKEALKIKRKLL
jgi:excisionase family DNA binding protein